MNLQVIWQDRHFVDEILYEDPTLLLRGFGPESFQIELLEHLGHLLEPFREDTDLRASFFPPPLLRLSHLCLAS